MRRGGQRRTLLRLVLAMMTSDSNHLSRGGTNGNRYLYRCPKGHEQRLRHHKTEAPRCRVRGCGQQMEYIPASDRP
ncbi:hypothetical protein AB0F15_22710 [Amycolatopsis sp. NPDC026612]|uniref:hypothetical protein n=1 Tax=Amycolatopsis sp. NPDC026612 TaxID=3155466 RepID=UPI0033F45A35